MGGRILGPLFRGGARIDIITERESTLWLLGREHTGARWFLIVWYVSRV
uniref:Uncharacterized protein n=1 Tax=Picea glauca TaxID=3330 RepID=A0A101LX82_PICGL|nr:hypothetical protein ABT39_MTgene6042 [Picea glauca]